MAVCPFRLATLGPPDSGKQLLGLHHQCVHAECELWTSIVVGGKAMQACAHKIAAVALTNLANKPT